MSTTELELKYRTILEGQQAQNDALLRASISSALQSNPDQFARAKSLADETGLPPAVVERNLPVVEQSSNVNRYEQLLRDNPRLADSMRNVNFAKLAHDDLDNLSGFERAAAWGRSLLGATGGWYGLPAAASRGFDENVAPGLQLFYGIARKYGLAPEKAPIFVPQGNTTRMLSEFASESVQQSNREMGRATQGMGVVGRSLMQGGQSVAMNLPYQLAAVAGRNPSLALIPMSLQTGSSAYQQGIDEGLTHEQALTFAAGQSTVEYWTERTPLQWLIGDISKGTGFFKSLGKNLVAENVGEQAATFMQDMNEWASLHPEKTLGDFMRERPNAALETAIATTFATLVQGGGSYGVGMLTQSAAEKQMKLQQAEHAKKIAEHLTQLATESKVRERGPAEFEAAVAEMMKDSPVTDVYIDAQKLGELYQDQVGEVLADIGISTEEYQHATAAGADLVVPIGKFASRLAARPEAKAMLDHIRFTEDGVSAAEAKELQKGLEQEFNQQAAEVLAELSLNEEQTASKDRVAADVVSRFQQSGLFAPQVAQSYGTYVGAFYAELGAAEGLSAEDAYRKYPFNLSNQSLPGIVLEQGGPSLRDWTEGDGNPNFFLHITDPTSVESISRDGLKAAADGYSYLWNSRLDAESNQIMVEARQSRGMSLDEATGTPYGYVAVDRAAVADRIETDPYTGEVRIKGDIPASALRVLTEFNQGAAPALDATYASENRTGVIVGGKPGGFGWTFDSATPPPPIDIPTQKGPRLNVIGERVREALSAPAVADLAEQAFGIKGLRVVQVQGSWNGEPEPSYALFADEITFEQASALSKMLGFAFAQEATVVTLPYHGGEEGGIPAAYIGSETTLTQSQLDKAKTAAKAAGLDYSTTVDGRGIKFLYFGDEAGHDSFVSTVGQIADAADLPLRDVFTVRSELNEASGYLQDEARGARGPAWLQDSTAGSPDLFRAVVDHLLVPYARAVGSEGYRLDPDRLAERFGLPEHKRKLIAEALRPTDGAARSTAPIVAGQEKLDVEATGHRGKPNVVDIMWALQNRAALTGQIAPGDYSDEAGEVLAQTIADEIGHHLNRKGGKSAVGWYDKALKKAKRLYDSIFPEIKKSTEKAMMFDAFLGITSQGNDVFANSIYAARVFNLVVRDGKTIPEAVKQLKGSFGNKTVQIENNILKFDALLKQNGYLRMRRLFNERKTVGEWNAILRKEERLFFNGEPLSITGAAENEVTGWFVFGPKIGSFINNLHGDYSTLTADLWFSRTWNRMLGYVFKYSPDAEANNYQAFVEALVAEVSRDPSPRMKNGKPMLKKGKPVMWEHGKDVAGMSNDDLVNILWEPARVLALAETLEARFRKGGYKGKSDLRRAAKNWIELRNDTQELPRGDLERLFQQKTMERAQRLIKKNFGIDITIADMQAALWYHEKELFGKLGVQDKRSAPADYADAAKTTVDAYNAGTLYTVKANSKSEADPSDELFQSATSGDTLGQQNRGAFNPSTRTITLLKDADLSTFLHEFGHFQLEIMADIASRPDAPARIKQDMDTLLKWFGVADLATWKAMSLEEQRPHHETFARGAEAYLFTGESPNEELAGVFSRFRAWLLNVYKNLRSLNVTLTPEVKGVFDRMLASEESIAAYRQRAGYRQIFQSAEEAGMTPEQWLKYQSTAVASEDEAVEELNRRSLKDMQWLANAKSRELSRLQKKAEGIREKIKAEVEKEVSAQRVYALRQFLQTGTIPEGFTAGKAAEEFLQLAGMQGSKIGLESLKAEFGEGGAAPWRYLATGPNGLVATEGLPAQMFADAFGYTSIDHMVKDLLAAEPKDSVVEGMTDQRMLEEHGELVDPRAIERAAEAAIHNQARARMLATELAALDAMTTVKGPAGKDKRGRPRSANLLAKMAKDYAKAQIARMKVRDVRSPARFSQAEQRAGRAAEAAQRKGDTREAAMHKRSQMLANAMWSEVNKAGEEMQKILAYFKKFDSKGTRDGLDAEYVDQIDQILERLELRKVSDKELRKRASLREWIAAQQELGIEPTLDPALVETLGKRNISELTVEELRGLRDTVKQIEHLGRLKKKLLTAKDQREFDAIVEGLVESIESNANGRTTNNRTGTTAADRAVILFKGFFASHRKIASLARQMDGSKDGGPVWDVLIRSMNAAGDRETTMREQATVKLVRLAKMLNGGGKMGGKGKFIAEIGKSLNREQRIAVALNVGNDGNKQRLMSGENWTERQLQAVLDTITPAEAEFVQAVWDLFESYRPLIAEKEKRVNGVEPDWLDATPITLGGAERRGGYYPVKYDSRASVRAEEHADAEDARAMLRAAYTSATTRRSFTKQRAAEVKERPLLLSMDGIYQGLNEVIHDLSWHEWLIDATRLLKDKRLNNAIRTAWGADVVQQFKQAMEDIGRGDAGPEQAFGRIWNHLRIGATVTGLGWNISTSLLQPLGFSQSAVRIGPKWVMRGLMRWTHEPKAAITEIYGKSEFMRLRGKTMQREINEVRNVVSDKSALRNATEASFFILITKMQLAVDVPTWLGAYEKAIVEGADESKAVALADQAVIDSQGGGQIKDLAGIQRGGALQKLFTNFYSYFNTTWNLAAERTRATDFRKPGQVAALAVDYLLLYTVPAVLGSLLKQLISSDDEDEDEMARRLIGEQISYLMGSFVGLREVTGALQYATGTKVIPTTYGGPAGLRLISELEKFGKQVAQGELDAALFRSAAQVVGIAMHWPTGQIAKTVEGAVALIEGQTDNPAALISGYR